MHRIRYSSVYSFHSLLMISFFFHFFIVSFFGFQKIFHKSPKIYRFISVNSQEEDEVKRSKENKKFISSIDKEEEGYFFKDRKTQIKASVKQSKRNLMQVPSMVSSGIHTEKNPKLGTEKKEDILKKSKKDSTIENLKSENILIPVENSHNKKRKFKSKTESPRMHSTILKKELESKRLIEGVLDRIPSKFRKNEDRLKLFRIGPKQVEIFEVSEMVLNKMASVDFDSDKKNKNDNPVSLSTRKTEYFRYFKHIKEKIEESWVWWAPEAKGLNGKLKLQFTLFRDGSLKKLFLLKSSGYGVLDDEAISAVTRASVSFRPFPLKLARKSLNIEGTFEYVSERFFVRKFLRN